jgi:hypothetical protein
LGTPERCSYVRGLLRLEVPTERLKDRRDTSLLVEPKSRSHHQRVGLLFSPHVHVRDIDLGDRERGSQTRELPNGYVDDK